MARTLTTLARCVLLAALALAAAGDGALAAKDKSRRGKAPKAEGWVELRSANFTIYSNASAARTRKIALSLEHFRAALRRITRGMQLDTRVPTRIYLFRNGPAYAPYKLDAKGNPLNVSGYFLSGPFANAITLDAAAGNSPMRVVFHEYFHAVMDASLGKLPLWLNEGLAEYYSTFQDRESGRVEVGHPIEGHVYVLQAGPTIPWRKLFTITTDSPAYNEGARQGAFYAQSWLLVHYLASDAERAKRLGRYLTALRSGTEESQAFVEAFEVDRAALTATLADYLESGGSHYTWELGDAGADPASFETREMETAEALFRLGDLLARRRQIDAARRHFEPARAKGYPAGPIEAALGFAAYYTDDAAAAERHLRQAIAAEVASAEPYVLLSDLLVNRYREEGASAAPSGATAATVLEARALLEAAPQPPGGDYHVLTGIANTYLLGAEDVGPGVAAVEQAIALRPLASEAVRLHACLVARQGRPAEAWAIVERDLALRDPDAARETSYCIADAVVRAAWESSEAGNAERADAILAAAVAATPDRADAARFAAMQRALAGGASIVFAEPEQDDWIERYNRAVELAGKGRYDDALETLEALLVDCDDATVCERAEASAGQLRGTVQHNVWVARFNTAVDRANADDRRGAIELLRELETEVTDPELREGVLSLLQRLGAKPAKRK